MSRPLPVVRRTLAAAAAAPLLLVGVAACGDSGAGSQAKDTTQPAVMTSVQNGGTVDPADFINAVADGLKDVTTAHVAMTTTLGERGSVSAEGDVDYSAKPPEAALTMALPMLGASSKAELRVVDGLIYVSMGDLTGGKFWKIDPSDKSGPLGDLGSMMDQLDPTAALQKVVPAIEKVSYVGAENGLDHYRLTVDPAKVAASFDLPARAAHADQPKSLTFDLWLDDHNRLSKVTMDLPVAGTEASMETTITNWGRDVHIQAPPADQVTEMPSFGQGSMKLPQA